MNLKSIMLAAALLPVCAYSAETLNLTMAAQKTLKVGARDVEIGQTGADGFRKFGASAKGISIPAADLCGESGTIIATIRREKPDLTKEKGSCMLLTLRCTGRHISGLYTSTSNQTLYFQYTDLKKSHYFNKPNALQFGKEHVIGWSWGNGLLRIYLDGIMIHEAKQPMPMAKVNRLNIGPYKDGYFTGASWGGDSCAIKDLKIYNHVLTPAEVAAASKVKTQDIRQSNPDKVNVPQASSKITIDGELNEAAWQRAGSLLTCRHAIKPEKTGSMPEHAFFLTFDRENLYVANRTVFPPRAHIIAGDERTAAVEPDVFGSESWEFYIETPQGVCRFGGNYAGGSTETMSRSGSWNAPWQYKTTNKMRIDDTVLWQCEAAIPWKTLGYTVPPVDPVKFNICRTWRIGEIATHSSLTSGGYGWVKEFGTMQLVPQTPVVHRLAASDPANGDFFQQFKFYSPIASEITCEISAARKDGLALPQLLAERKFKLKANSGKIEKINMKVETPEYDTLICKFSANGKTFMSQTIPFKLNEELFTVRKHFLHGKLLFKLFPGKIKRLTAGAVKLVMTDPEDKMRGTLTVPGEHAEMAFDRKWPVGNYSVALQDNTGKILGTVKFFYPGSGEYEKMSIDTTRIIPPFTALETRVEKNGFSSSMYNRVYSFADTLFPSSILNGKKQLLKAPLALIYQNGTLNTGKVTVTANAGHRMEYANTGSNPDASAAVTGWIEYDGTLFNQLKLTARKDMRDLKLAIKLDRNFGKYIHASNASNAWGGKLTAKISNGKRDLKFYPTVWLGNEEGGLSFFAESRANWKSSAHASYTLLSSDQECTLLVNLADTLKKGETLDIGFGLVATPVRPLAKNYPFDTFSSRHAAPLNEKGKRPTTDVILVSGGTLGGVFHDLPFDSDRKDADVRFPGIKEVQSNGGRAVSYVCDRNVSDEYPEMSAFLEEWAVEPYIIQDYVSQGRKCLLYECCPAGKGADFFLFKLKEMIQRGKYDGVYFDFGVAPFCNNALHGCKERIPLLAQRELYKKLCLIQMDLGIKEPCIVLHNTDYMRFPEMNFATHLFNGEHIRQGSSSIMHNNKDILDTYGIEMFAAELSSLPFGLTNSAYFPNDVLSKRYGGGKEKPQLYVFRVTQAALAGTLIHHTVASLHRSHYGLIDKVLRIYECFGVDKSDFIGYWKNAASVNGASDVYVSIYKHRQSKRALAVISNLGQTNAENITITFDSKALGFTPAKAMDMLPAPDPGYARLEQRIKSKKLPHFRTPTELGDFGSKINSIDSGKLNMSLKRHTFAIIELNQ